MRAVVQDGYGPPDVLRVADLPDPTPAADEVLVEVRAVSLNGSDRENLVGRPLYSRLGGLRRPRVPVPGSDVAGVVVAVGGAVSRFAVGDEVVGELPGYRGGLAGLVATRPGTLVAKPAGLSFVEASTVPQAGCIALRATRGVRPGDRVLVNGAGGAFVVALARHLGAEVTAVDRRGKAEHLRRLGAEHVVAYEDEDWATHRDRYDLVVDLVARRAPWRVHRAVRSGGAYRMVGGRTDLLLGIPTVGALLGRATGRHVGVLVVPQSATDLAEVLELVTRGAVPTAVDAVVPLDEAPAALARLAAGATQGKVVVTVP
ncbi:NAD(P)-dependent alcohol dehydrogenase [Cellulosimicrobium marinum]|uniref:NAD(P)-dependent alcohol dehydrogenase n=1 Tax=Cellulosimicrobium marinum TaxID=1638992 RepID=UPI001E3A536C|nr:NAD(P)-dependent alcohol dehydrogenase [Cellulosimicrobium marinum]MCB7135741.1 NAD(P)-dependent alcohol dehydrogenase [Cellulosimicrobium marinum]